MKTILYNPIFINPQAYYVFPRLTRYLQPDNESTSEPANYIGTIEVKVIAYGDTTLKRTYTNTDSIDLGEFKNTWIRISLFTKVGSCVLGEWKIGNMESDLPYIDPEVLASLKAVVIVGNKTNNDSDRAIVKNLVDPDNPFVISNAAFKLNSGFGKYETELSDTRIWTKSKDATPSPFSSSYNGLSGWIIFANTELTNSVDIPSIKIEVKGLLEGQELIYRYYDSTGQTNVYSMTKDGEYTLPADVRTAKTLTSNTSGFQIVKNETNTITITQIPSFEGAFVTDGIDDLITSTKTVQEMLGGSTEFTAVSMIHLISPGQDVDGAAYTNYIRTSDNYWTSNRVSNVGKTGIYGYSFKQSTPTVINNILGDKGDYTTDKSPDTSEMFRANFSVEGFEHAISGTVHASSVAWYWTIIANKVLTTDQINQVIAYFNLDRTLNPDILCNTIKQGITNENHAEFGDKLIDFSGNGRDIQLNNIAWKGDSGIGKYEVDFLDSSIWNSSNSTITSSKIDCKNAISHIMLLYYSVGSKEYPDIPSFKVIKTGADIDYSYIDETGSPKSVKIVDGVNILPASHNTLYSGSGRFCGFGNPGMGNSVTITQIPSHAGGLCLDGINDFGKVTGMPVYKDYTVVTDREIFANIGAISSKNNPGAFVETAGNSVYSFGQATSGLNFISTRSISYLSKYSYCGQSITAGAAEDGTDMWLGTIRDNDSRFFNGAIYSLMSFPYSMSEFLIERQLKKHKLGTLYPDMVEFRPIVKSNSEYQVVDCYIDTFPAVVGNYYPINSKLRIAVTTKGAADEVTSLTVNGVSLGTPSVNGNRFTFNGTLSDKSPQKINITIDEYIRYEDIVQPYPVLLRFNDENGNEVSWGGKFKVGSTITRIGSIADPESNLLNGLYSISGLSLNGKSVTSSTSIVEKQMVFKTIATYLLDNNEPNCILSPRLLRIPNPSYKILGYIPDISGHGNHGVIHNSAYALNSGANGYTEDFTKWTLYTGVKCTDSIISLDSSFNKQDQWILFKPKGSNINQFTINIKGIPDGGNLYLRLSTDSSIKLENGINEISSYTNVTNSTGFFIGANGLNLDWSNLVIEQVGEYEGAYCLDGVDDFVTIPTVTGGKQVLMKVNWQSIAGTAILYDQRTNGGFAIFNRDYDTNENKVPAYRARNIGGNTYIDGILNEYIYASQLQNITHNIVELYDPELNIGTLNPKIGSSYLNSNYAQMSLYDFMLFDNISTDDKIKQLNEYVGIEGNTEWRKTK